LETIRLYENSDKSAAQIEHDLELPTGIIHKWRSQLNGQGGQAFAGKGQATDQPTPWQTASGEARGHGQPNIFARDVHLASGTVTASAVNRVPAVNPGATYGVVIRLTVTTNYGEPHQIVVDLGNSQITTNYTLAQGQCNIPPSVTPASTGVVVLPPATAMFTRTPLPPAPTKVPPTRPPLAPPATFTRTSVPPPATLTFTLLPPPPTRVPSTRTPPPPTATFTSTLVPPTVAPTRTPLPPTPTATFTRTPVPPTAARTLPPAVTAIVSSTAAATGTLTTSPESVVDMLSIPFMNVSDPAVQAMIRQIHTVGQTQGVVSGNFRIVGDTTLVGISGADDPKANLGQYKAQFEPVIWFFAAGIKAANGPTASAGLSSADILNPAKGAGPCQKKSPLACALEAKPALIFIDVGPSDIKAKIPLDQFRNNVMTAVNVAVRQGTIPILVTMTGAANPADEPQVAQYNTLIYNVAKTTNVPLFNIYRVTAVNPAQINPANGELTSSPNKSIDLSPAGLKFGVNSAALHLLELLSGLQAAYP
jgi:hypothetical protein